MPLGKPEVLVNGTDKEKYQNPAEIPTEKQLKTLATALENWTFITKSLCTETGKQCHHLHVQIMLPKPLLIIWAFT